MFPVFISQANQILFRKLKTSYALSWIVNLGSDLALICDLTMINSQNSSSYTKTMFPCVPNAWYKCGNKQLSNTQLKLSPFCTKVFNLLGLAILLNVYDNKQKKVICSSILPLVHWYGAKYNGVFQCSKF